MLTGTPSDLAAGPDRDDVGRRVHGRKARLRDHRAGVVTEYTSPLTAAVAITRGGDGAIWMVDTAANSLGRLRAAGDLRDGAGDRGLPARDHRHGCGRHRSRAHRQRPLRRGRRRARARPADGRLEPDHHVDRARQRQAASPCTPTRPACGGWTRLNKRIGRYAGDGRDRVGAAASERRAERVHARLGRIGLVHEQGGRPARALLRGDRRAGHPGRPARPAPRVPPARRVRRATHRRDRCAGQPGRDRGRLRKEPGRDRRDRARQG